MNIFETFFAPLYELVPNKHLALLHWGDIRPDGAEQARYFTVEQLLSGVTEVYPDKRNMFFSVAPLAAPRNIKQNVLGSSVAWVDFDGYKDDSDGPPPVSLVPYSFAVASGGPGGYHLYWLLDRFVTASEIEALNKVLIKHLGNNDKTDKCWNANRVLRIPGTKNYKAERGETDCRLVEDNGSLRYNYNDLMKLGQFDPAILEIPKDKEGNPLSRSERDWAIVVALKKWGVSDDAIRIALEYHSDKVQELQRDRPDGAEHYLTQTITKVSESIETVVENKQNKRVLDDPPMNCTITPVGRLVDPEGNRLGLTVRVEWDDGVRIRAAKSENFATKASLLKWLRGIDGGLMWWGSDVKVNQLYGELVAIAPATTSLQVDHAGRYDLNDGTRVYIYGNDRALTWPRQEEMLNVTWEPKIGVNTGLSLGESSAGVAMDEAVRLYTTLLKIQPPEILYPALGWTVATLFKTLVEKLDGRVPILMLYGVRGSGKTSVIREALLRLVGLFASPISADITPFALYGNLSATQSWPVWIGEFRNSNKNADTLQQILRSSYDVGRVERGSQDMSVVEYRLTAPVVVDGETAFTDSANTDRAISLKMSYDTVITGQYVESFERLRTWPVEDWAQLARDLVGWSLEQPFEFVQHWYEQGMKRFEGLGFTSRVTNNIAVCWMGWAILAEYLGTMGIPVDLSIEPFVVALNNTHQTGIGNLTQSDQFVAQVSHQAQQNLPSVGGEYDGTILWFNLTRAMMTMKSTLPAGMIETQLEARRNTYVIGKRVGRMGIQWGVDLVKAQEMGLDCALGHPKMTVSIDGVAEFAG